MKISNDTSWDRTSDFPICGTAPVLQVGRCATTVLPRSPFKDCRFLYVPLGLTLRNYTFNSQNARIFRRVGKIAKSDY